MGGGMEDDIADVNDDIFYLVQYIFYELLKWSRTAHESYTLTLTLNCEGRQVAVWFFNEHLPEPRSAIDGTEDVWIGSPNAAGALVYLFHALLVRVSFLIEVPEVFDDAKSLTLFFVHNRWVDCKRN